MKTKLFVAIGLSVMLAASVEAQTLILTPSTVTPEAGVPFTLDVAVDTGGLPIAGFSVYFNMNGTDPGGNFIVQSNVLSPEWSFLSPPPAGGLALPNSGNSADYGNASTPDFSDLPAGANISLFTLTIMPNASIPYGTAYTIQTTPSSIFFYDLAGGGTEVALPASLTNITIIPEPSALMLLGAASIWFLSMRHFAAATGGVGSPPRI